MGAKSLYILYINLTKLNLYMKNSESHFASLSTSCEGISREKPYIILATLRCKTFCTSRVKAFVLAGYFRMSLCLISLLFTLGFEALVLRPGVDRLVFKLHHRLRARRLSLDNYVE